MILQNNDIGIAFSSSGSHESALERSCLRQTNVGLSSFSLRSARVDGNELTDNGFGVALVSSADVSVTRNNVRNSSAVGVFVSLGTNISARGNRITDSGSALVYDSSTGDIRFNLVERAAETGISLLSDHDVDVGFNFVAESGAGIELLEATGNSLQHNLIERSIRHGILLDASDDNTIQSNRSRANGADGLRIASLSSGNTIHRNRMLSNAEHDCHDNTIGAGTAGTANYWISNRGRSNHPSGLCSWRGRATMANLSRGSAR